MFYVVKNKTKKIALQDVIHLQQLCRQKRILVPEGRSGQEWYQNTGGMKSQAYQPRVGLYLKQSVN